jgi:sporulation protein YlmC with PRC-barrel domain
VLRSVSSLLGSSILANDGEMGHVHDILFDDRSWLVRYIVVETGSWLSGRRVLLSPIIAQAPDVEGRVLRVALTRDQVRNSPGIDTDLPVSRQQEIAMTLHYGWPAYWTA